MASISEKIRNTFQNKQSTWTVTETNNIKAEMHINNNSNDYITFGIFFKQQGKNDNVNSRGTYKERK